MSRPVLLFVGAVLLPGLLLGALALRSIQNQEALLDRQRTRLYEAAAEQVGRALAARIDERQRDFSLRVESLLGSQPPMELARQFDERLREGWPLAAVGFAVSLEGNVLSPFILGRPEARNFLVRNEGFLCQQASVEVIAVTPKGRINLADLDRATTPPGLTDGGAGGSGRFAHLIGDAQEGVLARFVDDQLTLWVWYRTPRDPSVVFGAQMDLAQLRDDLATVVRAAAPPAAGVSFALVDDRGAVVATSPSPVNVDWERPAVAYAVGEMLPHWAVVVGVYDPSRTLAEIHRIRLTLGAVVALLVGAIGVGGWLVLGDARRQLDLARKKSDFVSNVSHELRTPLTSIRLFAEMLADGRVTDPAKRRQHLGVIQAEAARLQRLITNVLDFSRFERRQTRLVREPVDLASVVREVVESFEPQLAAEGMVARVEGPDSPLRVQGDPDALAQVVNNLLSNAVKYAASGREILVRLAMSNGEASLEVLDHGPGVPHGSEERIFEQFFRCHDLLSSGIPGAGLGLTLARQIARAHGGEIEYKARTAGGSCFRFRMPPGQEPPPAPSYPTP